MENGVRKLIVAGIAVIALIFSIGNTFMIRKVSTGQFDSVCVVDVWKLSTEKALSLSLEKGKDEQQLKKEQDEFIAFANRKLSHPGDYGCGLIAVKGSILGNPRDITEVVIKDLVKTEGK